MSVEKIIEKINMLIEIANDNFTEWNTTHELRMSRIDGMVDVLSMVTGKEYIITENGLEEK